MSEKKQSKYSTAGVDIDKGNAFVEEIKDIVSATHQRGVLGEIGGFSSHTVIDTNKYKTPVIVNSTDGVGTKLAVAHLCDKHDTIGIDLVAMCVNDLIVTGAEPLFFLDYYATGTLSVDTAVDVVEGIGRGCELAGCSLVGGETAEMPGMYEGEDYDLAGFCVGVVEKSNIIDGSSVGAGDTLIGIASSGPHSNGYSLIRKILEVSGADLNQAMGNTTLGKALLTPTTIYVKAMLDLLNKVPVKALSHITGGGLLENIPRVLPDNCNAQIDTSSWQMPEVFKWLQSQGNVASDEMYRTFNCGVGMVICVAEADVNAALNQLNGSGHTAWVIGQTTSGSNEVELLS